MAFNAGAIVAKLKLDAKQFTAGVKTATGRITKMGNVTKVLLAGSLIYATKKLADFVVQGEKLRNMDMAFDRMADKAGTSADAVVDSVKAITGALTNKQIKTAANTLELLGIGMENTAKFTEIARAAGIALGKDTAFMLESIATGTARQSRLMLDNLGILISIEDANNDYAASLGRVASSLTDTEQRAAFLNAVMVKGDDIINAVGGEAVVAAEKVQTLAAAFSDLIDQLKMAASSGTPEGGWISKELQRWTRFSEDWVEAGKIEGIGMDERLNYAFGHRDVYSVGAALGEVRGLPAHLFTPQAGGTQEPTGGGAGLGRGVVGFGQHPGGPEMPVGSTAAEAMARQVARDASAAQLAAQKYFEAMLRTGPSGSGDEAFGARHVPGGASMENLPGVGALDYMTDVDMPELTLGTEELTDQFIDLTGVAQGFFSTLVTGAMTAGANMTQVLGKAIGGIASMIGKMLIFSGKGLAALGKLSPWQAIGAGVALLAIGTAISGALSGGSSSAVSVPSTPSPRQTDTQAQGGLILHVDGDFNGDPMWIDRLTRNIDSVLRANGRVEVFS